MIFEVRIGAKCQSGSCHERSQVFQDLSSIPAGFAWFSNSFSPVRSRPRKYVPLSPQIRPLNNTSINQSSKRLRTPLCGFCFFGVFACLFAALDARPDFFTWTWWSTLQVIRGGGLGNREKLRHWVDGWVVNWTWHGWNPSACQTDVYYTIMIQLCYWDDQNSESLILISGTQHVENRVPSADLGISTP